MCKFLAGVDLKNNFYLCFYTKGTELLWAIRQFTEDFECVPSHACRSIYDFPEECEELTYEHFLAILDVLPDLVRLKTKEMLFRQLMSSLLGSDVTNKLLSCKLHVMEKAAVVFGKYIVEEIPQIGVSRLMRAVFGRRQTDES